MNSIQKILATTLLVLIGVANSNAQKYFTKTGEISFYSHTPIEDIQAESKTATSVYDANSGKLQWAVLIKSFEFEKALMQEHFNENYMESSKFPKATFKGQLADTASLDLSKDGVYPVSVEGDLTIHGVSKPIATSAVFEVKKGVITANAALKVMVADYGIEIPSVVKDNIAKELEININANYTILERS